MPDTSAHASASQVAGVCLEDGRSDPARSSDAAYDYDEADASLLGGSLERSSFLHWLSAWGGWFSLRRKRSGRQRWWMPLAVGLLIALVLVVVTAISRLGQLPQELDPTVALVRLPGYDYKAPGRETEDKLEARLRSDTVLGNEITGLLLRHVMHRDEGSFAGVITVVGLEPAAAAENTHLDVARGLGQSGGGFVEETRIAGWPVGVVDTNDDLEWRVRREPLVRIGQ